MKRPILFLVLLAIAPLALAGVITENPTHGVRPAIAAAIRQQLNSGRPSWRLGPVTGLHAELTLRPAVAVVVAMDDIDVLTVAVADDTQAP